jgi:hypothetical protein
MFKISTDAGDPASRPLVDSAADAPRGAGFGPTSMVVDEMAYYLDLCAGHSTSSENP